MKTHYFLKMVPALFLCGCMVSEAVSNSGALVNNDVREIDIVNMGSGRYQGFVRGNVNSQTSDLRLQFTREVNSMCNGRYEILHIETGEITNMGYKKPIIEGTFVCK